MWKPVHLFAFKRKFDFLGKRNAALVLSTLINVVSLLGVVFVGLNFGIDFKGGIAIQARAKQGAAQLDQLRDIVGGVGVGEVSLQEFGEASTVLIRIQRQDGNPQCVAGAQRVGGREQAQLASQGGADGEDGAFFGQLSAHWKKHYAGWSAWVLTPDLKLPGKMRLKESRRVPMWNGPLECRLFRFDMVQGSARSKPAPP